MKTYHIEYVIAGVFAVLLDWLFGVPPHFTISAWALLTVLKIKYKDK